MKSLWCVLLVCVIAGQVGKAQNKDADDPNNLSVAKWDIAVADPGNPDELMKAKWDSIVNVLKDKELDTKIKAILIDKLISPAFDFQLMGKLTLGRTNWPKLNPAQREKFISLFVKRLKTSYRDKIMLYENEKMLFQPAVHNKDMVHIPMTLVSNDSKTAMLYKLHKVEKSWKVYDVEIEGVSILLTYRSQFEDILSRGTVEDLLLQLEKPAGS
jgi:phospholipid transport system substrate-binding protein